MFVNVTFQIYWTVKIIVIFQLYRAYVILCAMDWTHLT